MFSGWLIALLVWLLPASKSAAPFVIAALTYVVALAGLATRHRRLHRGRLRRVQRRRQLERPFPRASWLTLLGNLIGGAALAALLNHAPVAHDMAARQDGRG